MYYGGPILNNVVGVLHSTEYRLASTNTLTEGKVGFTLDSKILEDIAQGGGPLKRIVTLGMANWSASQLEEELEHPQSPAMSWLLMDYDEKLVFGQLQDTKPDDIWEDCLQRAVKHKTAEITSKISKMNIKIYEVPINYYARTWSEYFWATCFWWCRRSYCWLSCQRPSIKLFWWNDDIF